MFGYNNLPFALYPYALMPFYCIIEICHLFILFLIEVFNIFTWYPVVFNNISRRGQPSPQHSVLSVGPHSIPSRHISRSFHTDFLKSSGGWVSIEKQPCHLQSPKHLWQHSLRATAVSHDPSIARKSSKSEPLFSVQDIESSICHC